MRMTIWTYAGATPESPYWRSQDREACFIEHADGRFEWRWVSDGTPVNQSHNSGAYLSDTFKGKPLERHYWPQWYEDMDEYGLDDGL